MNRATPRPSLVLLHGFAGRPETWTPVLDNLPKNLPALAPTLLGHTPTHDSPPVSGNPLRNPPNDSPPVSGNLLKRGSRKASSTEISDSPPDSGDSPHDSPPVSGNLPGEHSRGVFEAEVDRLAGLVRSQEFSGSHLVGYSLGGRLALGLLFRHPGLFTAATLLGTHPGLGSTEECEARLRRDEAWAELLEEQGLDTFLDAWESQPLFESQTLTQRAAQRRLRESLDPSGLARAMRGLSLGRMPDFRPRLQSLSLPVCWVAGGSDMKFSALARECAEVTPAGSLEILPGAGHNAVLEQPDAVADLLQPHRAQDRALFNAPEESLI